MIHGPYNVKCVKSITLYNKTLNDPLTYKRFKKKRYLWRTSQLTKKKRPTFHQGTFKVIQTTLCNWKFGRKKSGIIDRLMLITPKMRYRRIWRSLQINARSGPRNGAVTCLLHPFGGPYKSTREVGQETERPRVCCTHLAVLTNQREKWAKKRSGHVSVAPIWRSLQINAISGPRNGAITCLLHPF